MSIVIKGMKMPDSCLDCEFTKEKFSSLGRFINCCLGLGDVVGYSTGQHVDDRHPDCPLVELPEHHGRLIDADAFAERIKSIIERQGYDNLTIEKFLTVGEVLNAVIADLKGMTLYDYENAPTVIEAE